MPSLFDILGYAGNLLDLPGSSVRDILSGRNPFDQWATPFSDVNRASGRDVLAPLLGQNEETGMSGWLQNPMEGVKDIAGFGLEMAADPLNFVSLSPLWRALKGRKAAQAANAAELAASKGRYGYVNSARLMDDMLPAADDITGKAISSVGPVRNPLNPELAGTLDEFFRNEFDNPMQGQIAKRVVGDPQFSDLYVKRGNTRQFNESTDSFEKFNDAVIISRIEAANPGTGAYRALHNKLLEYGKPIVVQGAHGEGFADKLRHMGYRDLGADDFVFDPPSSPMSTSQNVWSPVRLNNSQVADGIQEMLTDGQGRNIYHHGGEWWFDEKKPNGITASSLVGYRSFDDAERALFQKASPEFLEARKQKSQDFYTSMFRRMGRGYDPNVDRVAGELGLQQRLLGYTPAPENPMFPGREIVHHGGHDWSASATPQHPYGMYDMTRAGIGEGGQMYGPGFYVADAEDVSRYYQKMVQEDLTQKVTKSPMYQLRNVIDDYTDSMSEPVDVKQLQDFFRAESDNPVMAEAGALFDILNRNDYFGADVNDLFFWEEMQNAMLSKKDLEEYIGRYEPEALEALSRFTTDKYGGKANLYKLDMPAGSKSRFMRWESPLSAQPQAVQDLIDDPQKLISPDQWKLLEQAQEYDDALTQLLEREAEITADPSLQYLMPIIREQLSEARDLLTSTRKTLLDQKVPWDIVHGRFENIQQIDGETIADLLMGNQPHQATLEEASGLRQAGVPGMTNEANIVQGTRNYAIWDPDLIKQMRIREINGERVPINPMLGPTTQIQRTVIPQIADTPLVPVQNPMALQQMPGMLSPAMQGALYQALARFNTYGGTQ